MKHNRNNAPNTPKRAGVQIASVLGMAAGPLALFVYMFNRTNREDGIEAAVTNGLAVLGAVVIFACLIFGILLLLSRANHRLVSLLASERPGAIVIGATRTPATKKLFKESRTSQNVHPKEGVPTNYAFLADDGGVEIWTGGLEPKTLVSGAVGGPVGCRSRNNLYPAQGLQRTAHRCRGRRPRADHRNHGNASRFPGTFD